MLLSLALSAAPQNKAELSGRVVNGLTHEPIRGAVVLMRVPLKDAFSESEVGFLTGADGRFSFSDPPRKSAEVSATRPGWVRQADQAAPRALNLSKVLPPPGQIELELW